MPVYLLEPVSDREDDPEWIASTYAGRCMVWAKDKRNARLFVARRFRVGPAELLSPWLRPDLASLRELPSDQDDPLMPMGTVVVDSLPQEGWD